MFEYVERNMLQLLQENPNGLPKMVLVNIKRVLESLFFLICIYIYFLTHSYIIKELYMACM